MTSPDHEAAISPNSLFDEPDFDEIFPKSITPDTISLAQTCACGYTSANRESFERHQLGCLERVAHPTNSEMLHHEDAVDEQRNPVHLQAPTLTEYLSPPSMLSLTSQQHDPRSPRVARPPPDFGALHEHSHDFMAEARQYLAQASTPQFQGYSAFLNDPSTPEQMYPSTHQQAYPQPQPTYAQTQPGHIPTNDPYLEQVFYQNLGHATQPPNMNPNPAQNTLPFTPSHRTPTQSNYPPTQAQPSPSPSHSPPPSPASRTSSVVNLTTNTFRRMGSFLRGGRGRGRGRGKTPIEGESHNPNPNPTADNTNSVSSSGPATKKRKKINNDKQAKSRQKKADKQEALEAEVQRLRAVLRGLGGCGEGEGVTGTNWF